MQFKEFCKLNLSCAYDLIAQLKLLNLATFLSPALDPVEPGNAAQLAFDPVELEKRIAYDGIAYIRMNFASTMVFMAFVCSVNAAVLDSVSLSSHAQMTQAIK